MEEETQQHLRSRATELLLREDWTEYINLYTHSIHLLLRRHHQEPSPKLRRQLCSALSHRADAHLRLRNLPAALHDCDHSLRIDPAHPKSLLCKGKVLLDLDQYTQASDCFHQAASLAAGNTDTETIRVLINKCRMLDAQSKTGSFDLSDWVVGGFNGATPDLAEYIGPVEIRKSEAGRGLFASKNVDAGTVLIVTKAVVVGRGILPEDGSGHTAKSVLWKDLVDRILDICGKCSRTLSLIYRLSSGIEEGEIELPNTALFRPDASDQSFNLCNKEPDGNKILKILDVNLLTDDSACAKVLGKNRDFYGVGLWLLPSFVNHSCCPNARRLHIGDKVVIHASRDVKAGEEVSFGYFDVLLPLSKRRECMKSWGFLCQCERCGFEEEGRFGEELMEMMIGSDTGEAAARLEEGMRRWMVKGKEKGWLRASFWDAYCKVYKSEKLVRRWGVRIPAEMAVAESVAGAVGGDERVLKVVVGRMKRGGGGDGVGEMERVMKLGRGTYGKVMKRRAMRALFELDL